MAMSRPPVFGGSLHLCSSPWKTITREIYACGSRQGCLKCFISVKIYLYTRKKTTPP